MLEWHQLAPFILHTVDERPERARAVGTGGRKGCWSLHLLLDGRGAWRDRVAGRQVWGNGEVLLNWRRLLGPIEVPRGCRYLAVYFDVLPRAREHHPTSGWRPLREFGADRQRGPFGIWGSKPGHAPGGPAAAAAATLLPQLCTRWWRSEADQQVCNLQLAGWLGVLVDQLRRPPPSDPVEAAEAHARRRFTTGCTVAELAALVGMPTSSFSEIYLARRGHGPGQFLRHLRYQHACELLRGQQGVAEVALACGYRNRASFSRAFRAEAGISPSDWRRAQRGA